MVEAISEQIKNQIAGLTKMFKLTALTLKHSFTDKTRKLIENTKRNRFKKNIIKILSIFNLLIHNVAAHKP